MESSRVTGQQIHQYGCFELLLRQNIKVHPLLISGHRIISLPKIAVLLTSLLLNIGLTSVFDGMNLILSVTLRWALFLEGTLVFNSISHLYTSTQSFGPCRWTMNILETIALIVGYGATSILATDVYVIAMINPETVSLSTAPITGSRYALDFNAWGMLGLGFALSLQAGPCIWTLVSGRKVVKSWSSNCLGTILAFVCASSESFPKVDGDHTLPWYSHHSIVGSDTTWQSSRSSQKARPTSTDTISSVKPRYRQASASASVPLTRRLTNIVLDCLGCHSNLSSSGGPNHPKKWKLFIRVRPKLSISNRCSRILAKLLSGRDPIH